MYGWPGNVRELKNAAERFVLMGDASNPDMDDIIRATAQGESVNLHDRVEWFEKSLIQQALAQSAGSINATLESLGTPRKTLYDKMRKYNIDKDQFK